MATSCKHVGRVLVAAIAAVVLTAGLAEGTLPNSTLTVLRELWEVTGGPHWTRCQWTPELDPCAPPWGQPQWSTPNVDDADDDDGAAWGLNVCFVCEAAPTPSTATLLAISLGGSNLTGAIPASLGQLTSLMYLGLGNNFLYGPIPESLGQLTALNYLELFSNFLSGSIPPGLCNLTALVQLGLSNNQLVGEIPADIGNLTALTELALIGNQLTGSIPESLGRATSLSVLALSYNSLSGRIPASLGSLTRMSSFEIYNNQLSGPIPPSLGNLTAVQLLLMNDNQLDGAIPDSLGNLAAVTFLDLSNNQLSGPIPDSLGNLTALTLLYLFNNQLSSQIPSSLGNLVALTKLYLYNNQLTGPIPLSLGNLIALTELFIYDNALSGQIPESFGSLSALTTLYASTNRLSGHLPETLGNLSSITTIVLNSNNISGPLPDSIGRLTSLSTLDLQLNSLSGPLPESIGELTALTRLILDGNQLDGSIPAAIGNLVALTDLGLSANRFSGTIPSSLGNLTSLRTLELGMNFLTGRIPESFSRLRALTTLGLAGNALSQALNETGGIFTAYQGGLVIYLGGNDISYLGPIFESCVTPTGDLTLELADNSIDTASMYRALESATSCAASLTLVLANNSVDSVDLRAVTNYTLRYCNIDPCPRLQAMSIAIDLSNNPISTVTQSRTTVPKAESPATYTTSIVLDLSASTGIISMPTSFSFVMMTWDTRSTLTLNLAGNPGVDPGIVRSLSLADNSPRSLVVNLSRNSYTAIPSGTFHGSHAISIDLSHNAITHIADDSFEYNFVLASLDLSYNLLTVLTIGFLDTLPALAGVVVHHNSLVALPATNNHIADRVSAESNTVQCETYGPIATNCSCHDGLHFSTEWNYVRCTHTTNGCPPNTLWNKWGTGNAPWSTCINGSMPGRYFYNNSFKHITNCSTYLAYTGTRAYEVVPPTTTTDRICSLCSTCPQGYHTIPCTATDNTRCERYIPAWQYAIYAVVFVVGLFGAFGAGYGRTQKRQRYQTQSELELTERLLDNVQDENERFSGEIADMEQAWVIKENDLGFGEVIGEGAYGKVFGGTWGHIPVAIKVLRQPLDNMDPGIRKDFDREVKFMRSIRHPHILIFYGAGVDADSRAFLVTELMAGSMRSLLLDHTSVLSWETRLVFANDIASGMAYLHERGTIHRDLKADNCFLGENYRVKVADFGTGRIAKHIQNTSSEGFGSRTGTSSEALNASRGDRTLSHRVSRAHSLTANGRRDYSSLRGLSRRIATKIIFPDYSCNELVQIMVLKLEKDDYRFEASLVPAPDGSGMLSGMIEAAIPEWMRNGPRALNGGLAERLLEEAKRNIGTRLNRMLGIEVLRQQSKEERMKLLFTITHEDVKTSLDDIAQAEGLVRS